MRGRSVAGLLAAVVAVSGGLVGCSADSPKSSAAHIEVDHPTALLDQPAGVRITGLAPGDTVTLGTSATDYQGKGWSAQAVFRADGHGVVDPGTTAPLSGSYQGVDDMGLFWSMGPDGGDPNQSGFAPEFSSGAEPSFSVALTVTAHGRRLATTPLIREASGPGVTRKDLTQANDQVTGTLFLPPATGDRHPAVLLFGGSEGGVGSIVKLAAAQLASHGYPALVLGYFGLPGLPSSLQDVPLEYFAGAARLLAAQPQTDPAHLFALGDSRGSEAALLLAQDYPDLVHGAILYAPSAQVNPGFPNGGTAWTVGGQPVPSEIIPVDRVSGPVLAIAGAADQLWTSAPWARQIDAALTAAHRPDPHQALVYPGAGHGVGLFPYLPQGTALVHPVTGRQTVLGGTRAGNAAAQEAGWPKVLALLAGAGQ